MAKANSYTPPMPPIPVTLITGFLGAGKTTLLNRILKGDHGLRIAVMVNDFGAVNIDSALIVGVEGETVSLANGCICCTIRDDLLAAALSLVSRPEPPEYIVIETSGVSDPYAVAQTFLLPALQRQTRLDSIIAVVDAEQIRDVGPQNEMLAMDQVGAADLIVLNKVDLVDAVALGAVRGWIRDVSPDARVIEVTFAQAPLELLLGVGRYNPDRLLSRPARDVYTHDAEESGAEPPDGHSHDHGVVFSAWTYASDEAFSRAGLERAIDNLPPTIYRAKGFIWLSENPVRKVILQVVGKRASLSLGELWPDGPRKTEIVVIGAHGKLQPERLKAVFDSCRASAPAPADDDRLKQAMDWVRRSFGAR